MNKETIIIDNRVGDNFQGLIDLFNYVKLNIENPTKIIELGSFIGASTKLFAQNFPNSTIYAIDMWMNDFDNNDPICKFDMNVAEQMFNENTKEYLNIEKIKMNTINFSKIIKDGYFDFIYIDAGHSYKSCKQDILNYLPKIKVPGIISGHDYLIADYTGVKKAVDEIFKRPNIVFKDSSWAVHLL